MKQIRQNVMFGRDLLFLCSFLKSMIISRHVVLCPGSTWKQFSSYSQIIR